MLKRVTICIVLMILLILLVAGCSEFFGTVSGRIAAQNHALEYIHNEYNIPLQHLKADFPSYRYGFRQYITTVHNSNGDEAYIVEVRLRDGGELYTIEVDLLSTTE